MPSTPYGLVAEKNGRRLIRRFETEEQTREAVADFEATGWDVEYSAPIEEPWSERRKQVEAAQAYALDEARSRVRIGDY